MSKIIEVPNDLVARIVTTDILQKFDHLIHPRGPYYIDADTHKIKVSHAIGVSHRQPWLHYYHDHTRPCMLLHHFFAAYKMVPKRCMYCWKIVVEPRTIVELCQLNVLLEKLKFDSKCGIEIRKFVNRNYGGYFYLDTKKEAMERYDVVREEIDKRISPEIPMHVKRYCTEFEMQKGSTKAYNRPKEADHWEELFWDSFEIENEWPGQPPMVKRHIMRMWFEFAWERGDLTVMELNQGEPLYTPCDQYQIAATKKELTE
jgi:hypothetical protein